jgi:hypothetical protein
MQALNNKSSYRKWTKVYIHSRMTINYDSSLYRTTEALKYL